MIPDAKPRKQIGIIGLGRMGANMARRLVRGGHEVVVSNRSPGPIKELEAEGAVGAGSLGELVERLAPPRAIWISLPAGEVTENTLNQLTPLLSRGDIIVDSGNSFYKDTIGRAERLKEGGLDLLDQGTSSGIWGLENGFCLMDGGSRTGFESLEPASKRWRRLTATFTRDRAGRATSSRWCITGSSTACSRLMARASRCSRSLTSMRLICARSHTCGIRAASFVRGCLNWPSALSRKSPISLRFAAMSKTRAKGDER